MGAESKPYGGSNKSQSHKKEFSPFMHPDRLSEEERENLIHFVPKDTIELLKEGHTEYIIKWKTNLIIESQ